MPEIQGQTDAASGTSAVRGTYSGTRFGDLIARTLGWFPGMLGDPAVFLRWLWLWRHGRRGIRTLDAGCGSGWFVIYLAKGGGEVIGVSFDEAANAAAIRRAAAVGATNARFIQGDLRDLDRFGESLGKFDQIICFETIEHIRDDEKLLHDLASRLNPGGRLMITTPSDNHPPLIGEEMSESEDGGHVRFGYSQARLRQLCSDAGLRMIKESRSAGWVSQKLFNLTRRLTPLVGWRTANVLVLLARPVQLFDVPLTRMFGYPELCVMAIAELPADSESTAHR